MTTESPAEASLTVRLFAGLREAAGWGERRMTFATPPAPTPRELWERLDLLPPRMPDTVRVAVNHGFVPADVPLRPGDEVAFLPPITGG
jgi:molybdopterin synthase sulfur carrier subunit